MAGYLRNVLGINKITNAAGKDVFWCDDVGNQALVGLQYLSAADSVTASGTNQATAFQLTSEISRIASGTGGIILPPSYPGLDVYVINTSGAAVQVYGNASDTIDGNSATVGVSQMNGSMTLYAATAPGAYYSNGIGTGYAGQFPTLSYTNAITAKAGGGQSASTPLTTVLNRVTTVATAADSVTLPVAVPGMQITVANAAATNSMNVFPNTGDAINALAANAAFAVAAGKTATFYTTAAGFWHSILSA